MRFATLLCLAACTAGRVASPPLDKAELRARVRAEFRHAWDGYVRYAWGHDELRPKSKTPRDWYAGTLLITPVDALDSLILLGETGEAERARKYIDEHLSFDQDLEVKNFEIVIRVLGGLLSAHQLTGDTRLLELADDLGARLLPAFNSPTGMPYTWVNLRTGKTRGPESNPAEVGTLVLEFGTLSKLTGKPQYLDKARHALLELYRRRSKIGLVGEGINVETGNWTRPASHIGGGIDSYYEYLLKGALLFGDDELRTAYDESMKAVNRYVADESTGGLWYGEVDMNTGRRTATRFGGLEAFFPGTLVLAGDLDRAQRLEDSAYRMWTTSGIEPEVFDYKLMKPIERGYPLRPEIIESAWYLHERTRDPKYLEMGRTFLDGIMARCRVEAGYTVLKDVTTGEQGDLMPSYFFAETLKYLDLLFGDSSPVQGAVFNTEAHPLRRTW
jgi:mannosidase alpha-like ER degradation enhancer 2